MRHLFVPACVCLMTLSGSAGTDSKLSLVSFTGAAKNGKKVFTDRAPTDTAPVERAALGPAGVSNLTPVNETARDRPAADVTVIASLDADAPPDGPMVKPRPIPLPPIAKPVVHRTSQEICDTVAQAAQSNDLPVPFFISLLFQESRFKPGVVSSAGAQGIAQFMPGTAASMGLENPFDPLQAIPASARLLRNLMARFGNLGLAAAAYNAGPRRIQEWLAKKGKLPEETKGYVKTITGRAAETWTSASAVHPGQRVPLRAPCQEAAGLYAAAGPETIPLPEPSPLKTTVIKTVVIKTAALKSAQPEKSTKSAQPEKSTTPQGANAVSVQLAARKHHNTKQKLQKVAQR